MRNRTIVMCVLGAITIMFAACGDDDPAGPGTSGGQPFNTSQLPDTISVAFGGVSNLAFGRSGNLLLATVVGSVHEYRRTNGVRSPIVSGDATLANSICAVWDPATELIYTGTSLSEIISVDPTNGSSQLEKDLGLGFIQQILIAPAGFGGFGGMLLVAMYAGGGPGLVAVDQKNSFSVLPFSATPVTDIEFAPDGTLYATRYIEGEVARVASNGTTTVFADSLGQPEGIAIDTDGSRMWVAHTFPAPHKITEITIPGEKKTVIATPTLNPGFAPTGLAYDGFGNLVFVSGVAIMVVDFLDVR